MGGPGPTVVVEGLSEFRGALKAVSGELPKMLRLELKEAAEAAARRARERYAQNFGGGTSRRRRGKGTAGTIRAVASQSGAGVSIGGARYPWVPGQEFGSNKYRQFFPWTGPGPGNRGSWGRIIFPAVRDEAEDTVEDIATRFAILARRAYPEP